MGNDGGDADADADFDETTFSLTDRDREILSMRDEDYQLQTWEDLKEIISSNALEKLTRLPSQLRAYLKWSAATKAEYGSMTSFILKNRVCWPFPDADSIVSESATPFLQRNDYCILVNDWPYGLTPDITHVVVWLKNRLPTDEMRGDLTGEGRRMVEEFVEKTFVKGLGVEGEDRVMWFKNWTGLQSVRGLEHVHVLVRGVDVAALEKVVERPWEDSHYERVRREGYVVD